MGVIQLTDEGVCPGLAGVDADVHVVLPVPFPPFRIRHGQRISNGCREVGDIPRVD